MRLQVIINDTWEIEKVLLNIDKNEVIIKCDAYGDYTDDYIYGFLDGIKYSDIEYEQLDDLRVTPDMEIFKLCDFCNCDYDDIYAREEEQIWK